MLSRKFGRKSASLLQLAIRNNYVAKNSTASASHSLSGLLSTQGSPFIGQSSRSIGSRYLSNTSISFNQQQTQSQQPQQQHQQQPQTKSEQQYQRKASKNGEHRQYQNDKRQEALTPLFKELNVNVNKLLVEATPNDAFDYLVANYDSMKSEFGYFGFHRQARKELRNTLTLLLTTSIKETKNPSHNTLAAPNPKALLQFYMASNLATTAHFNEVIYYLISIGASKDGLALFTEFREYVKDKPYVATLTTEERSDGRFVERAFNVRTAGLIAYLGYIHEHNIKADSNFAKQLFGFENLPSQFLLKGKLNEEAGIKDNSTQNAYLNLYKQLRAQTVNLEDPAILDKLRDYARRGNINEVRNELESLRQLAAVQGKTLPEGVYTVSMSIFAKANVAATSLFLWNEMIKAGIVPSVESWNALIFAASRKGFKDLRTKKVEAVYQKLLEQTTCKPNSGTYASLIAAYSNLDKFDKVEEVYQKAQNDQQIPVTYSIEKEYLLAQSKVNVDAAFAKLKEKIDVDNFVPDIFLLNNFLSIFAKVKKFEKVSETLGIIEKFGTKADVATYTVVLDMVFKQSRKRGEVVTEEVLEKILTEMKSNGIDMNAVTYASLIDGLVKDGVNIEAGRLLFQYLQTHFPINKTIYTTMIQGELNSRNFAVAEALFDQFWNSHEVTNKTVQMLNLMINGFARQGELLKAFEYFSKIDKEATTKLQPNRYSYYFVLKGALQESNTAIAEKVLESLAQQNFNSYGRSIPAVIIKLNEQGVKVPANVLDKARSEAKNVDNVDY